MWGTDFVAPQSWLSDIAIRGSTNKMSESCFKFPWCACFYANTAKRVQYELGHKLPVTAEFMQRY